VSLSKTEPTKPVEFTTFWAVFQGELRNEQRREREDGGIYLLKKIVL
jgi:hypothetical protein